jgi:RimJ/RimL family protein N-acetyltransferase
MTYMDLSPIVAPRIETGRLLLRAHTLADAPASAALWADETVTRFIGGRPHTREESWARLLRYAGHWSLLGYGYWLVEEKESGAFVGEVGLADYHRDVQPPIDGVPEIGWVLSPGHHGKGYAAEAVQAVIDWADSTLHPARIVCLIHPENAASLRLAHRFGFVACSQMTFRDEPSILLEMLF